MRRINLLLMALMILMVSAEANAGLIVSKNPPPPKAYVLRQSLFPAELKKYHPAKIYIKLTGKDFYVDNNMRHVDTITNLARLKSKYGKRISYRLVFDTKNMPDSAYQLSSDFKLVNKILKRGNELIEVQVYDATRNITDSFTYNYLTFLSCRSYKPVDMPAFFRLRDMCGSSVKPVSVWSISIGVNKYDGLEFHNSVFDAIAYDSLYKQHAKMLVNTPQDFHSYLLLNESATKENILRAFREIAAGATRDDYFIFSFSGVTVTMENLDKVMSIYFLPYNSKISYTDSVEKDSSLIKTYISSKAIQEHIQQIAADRQLFLTEACNTAGFKTELIRLLMQNSPDVASILNKNRVIIAPNKTAYDSFKCNGNRISRGPLNYAFTKLDAAYNVYEIFDDKKGPVIANTLKSKLFDCDGPIKDDYFDVFFEKQFIRQYNEIFGNNNATRGMKPKAETLRKNSAFSGKKYALIIGTDIYNAIDWPKLVNPVYDATAVAGELRDDYGFDVKLLINAPMDSIYSNLQRLNRTLTTTDQLVIYIAGHGDFEPDLLDDGFVVCTDSKPVNADPMRNSYIQHSKLKKMLNKLSASQMLVILDICFGGTFDESILGNKMRDNSRQFNPQTTTVAQFLNDKSQYKIRRMLSSAGKEPAYDGKIGQHSPFATQLLMVLKARGEGSLGIVTLSDIFNVLQQQSMNETARLRIKPYKGPFGDDEALGEFVLLPVDQQAEAAK